MDTRLMVGGRVMNAVSTSSTARALEAAIGVKIGSMKILEYRPTILTMRYAESGIFDK